MIVTTTWIEANYNKFNNLYWNGSLPKLVFKTNRARNTWGFASFKYDYYNNTIHPEAITLSNYYDSPENVKIQTLLHEMIHIADYFFHPEHFVKNHRRVSGRTYDPHGYWFSEEAKRISKMSGYKVANHVTTDEMNSSTLSESAELNLANKYNKALICAIIGTNGKVFYFKTDINKVEYLKKYIRTLHFYAFSTIKSIKFYKFKDPNIAEMRSCATKLMGWTTDLISFKNKLTEISATTYYA